MKTVGVIGGMGPAATIDFLARLLRATPAARDQDHLHWLADCDPTVPDRNAALAGTGPSPGPAMARMAARLEAGGADFLVIACNTAHAFADDVRRATRLPLIDMVAETAAAIADRHPAARRIGLLAADGCLAAGLYQRALLARGRDAILLPAAEQAEFMALIYAVKAGEAPAALVPAMRALADRLAAAGAELLVAACTEVPLVLDGVPTPLPLVSATDILVARTIAFARAGAPAAAHG